MRTNPVSPYGEWESEEYDPATAEEQAQREQEELEQLHEWIRQRLDTSERLVVRAQELDYMMDRQEGRNLLLELKRFLDSKTEWSRRRQRGRFRNPIGPSLASCPHSAEFVELWQSRLLRGGPRSGRILVARSEFAEVLPHVCPKVFPVALERLRGLGVHLQDEGSGGDPSPRTRVMLYRLERP